MTRRQAQVLDFIRRYQTANYGASPSCKEIAHEIGVGTHGQAWRVLMQLEDRRYIKREASVKHGHIEIRAEAPRP